MSTLPNIVDVEISFTFAYSFIFASCGIGLIFGLWNWYSVMSIKPELRDEDNDTESPLINSTNINLMYDIAEKIQNVKRIINSLGRNNFSISRIPLSWNFHRIFFSCYHGNREIRNVLYHNSIFIRSPYKYRLRIYWHVHRHKNKFQSNILNSNWKNRC